MLITVCFVLVQYIHAQEYKFLKPNLDDSCTILKHILDEKNEQEFLIYLDKKHWSEDKKILSDFSYHESTLKGMYPSYKDILKGREQKHIPVSLPKRWIPLSQYKGKLILYCSIEFNDRFHLTDSTITEFEMGGPYTRVIKEASLKGNKYSFKLYEPYENSISEINIHIIDKRRQIAIWEFKQKVGSGSRLFIPVESIPFFDIISTISYDAMMDPSLDFIEKVDIEKFLKSIE